jgi:hypothetical protein
MKDLIKKARQGKFIKITDLQTNKIIYFKRHNLGLIQKLVKTKKGLYRVQFELTAREFIQSYNEILKRNGIIQGV